MKKIIFLLLLAAAGGYWLVLSKPGMYYGTSLVYKNFTLRARGPLPTNMEGVLDKVYDKITAAELAKPDQKFDIYLTGGKNEFSFFAPFQRGVYYRVCPLNGAIYIAAAEFGPDRVRSAPGAADYRTLSSELMAAAAVEMLRRSVEPLKYMFMKEWKIRGYAERVSGGTGAFLPADLCTGSESDPAFLDFKYGMTVDFALKEEGVAFSEFLQKESSYEGYAARLKKMQCGG